MISNIMLDLETMSLAPNAAIVSIGAVEFGPDGLGRKFYCSVDLASSVSWGLDVSAATVLWWLGQSEAARMPIVTAKRELGSALMGFRDFIAQLPGEPFIWANSPAFDCVVLRSAYQRCCIKEPWSYRNERCLRTLRALYPAIEPLVSDGVPHHALDDAVYQARHAAAILAALTPVSTSNGRRDSDSD